MRQGSSRTEVIACTVLVTVLVSGTGFLCWSISNMKAKPKTAEVATVEPSDKLKSGFMSKTPEQNAKEVTDILTSTPEGKAAADRLVSKDDQLTEFQKANGISDRIAEAAIKEWVTKHGGNFDWNLEDVKEICLRNKRDGIPYDYLPESEKRK